jgi:hypothetical protein
MKVALKIPTTSMSAMGIFRQLMIREAIIRAEVQSRGWKKSP